jgi:hypothetical protein
MRQRFKVDMPCTDAQGNRLFWKSRLVYAGCIANAINKAQAKLNPEIRVASIERIVVSPISDQDAEAFIAKLRGARH